MRRRMDVLEREGPFPTKHNADFALARMCYAVCRLLKPEVVIETGVAYGVTTAFILKALQMNGRGRLYSIDLPPLRKDADAFVGYLVPEELKGRWSLHRGVSKRILPKLLSRLGRVDIFVHDSLHTLSNMLRELRLVTSYLERPSIVIADDIQRNEAFAVWVKETSPTHWAVFREEEKEALFGIAVFL